MKETYKRNSGNSPRRTSVGKFQPIKWHRVHVYRDNTFSTSYNIGKLVLLLISSDTRLALRKSYGAWEWANAVTAKRQKVYHFLKFLNTCIVVCWLVNQNPTLGCLCRYNHMLLWSINNNLSIKSFGKPRGTKAHFTRYCLNYWVEVTSETHTDETLQLCFQFFLSGNH